MRNRKGTGFGTSNFSFDYLTIIKFQEHPQQERVLKFGTTDGCEEEDLIFTDSTYNPLHQRSHWFFSSFRFFALWILLKER